MRTALLIIIAQFLFALSVSGAVDVGKAPAYNNADYNKQNEMDEVSREMAKTANQEIILYGKTVDFDGNPVSGAVIEMNTRVFGAKSPQNIMKKSTVTSDDNGLFLMESFGELIELEDIRKEGYVYHFKYNPKRTFHSAAKEKRKGVGYEPDKPIIFRVRKLAPSAFILSEFGEWSLRPGDFRLIDLYRMTWIKNENDLIAFSYSTYDRDWHGDLRVTVEGEAGNYRVVLQTPDEGSGMAVAEAEHMEELTGAPRKGYRNQLVLPANPAGELFAYVKSADGPFYSRIKVNYSDRGDFVNVRVAFHTNPAGGTSLEPDMALQHQYNRDYSTSKRWNLSREKLRKGELFIPQPEPQQ